MEEKIAFLACYFGITAVNTYSTFKEKVKMNNFSIDLVVGSIAAGIDFAPVMVNGKTLHEMMGIDISSEMENPIRLIEATYAGLGMVYHSITNFRYVYKN